MKRLLLLGAAGGLTLLEPGFHAALFDLHYDTDGSLGERLALK